MRNTVRNIPQGPWSVVGHSPSHVKIVRGDYADEGEPDDLIEVTSPNASLLGAYICDTLNVAERFHENAPRGTDG